MVVGVVPPDQHYFQDVGILGKGIYSYVVVAKSHKGLSIPKARAQIDLDGIVIYEWDRSHDDNTGCQPMLPLESGQSMRIVAASQATSVSGFQWITTNLPSYITLSGVNTDTLTITNNYNDSYQSLYSGIGIPTFSLRCAVSHAGGTDTSLSYYPSYSPLDSVNRFVSVGVGMGLVPDGNLVRSLDFVAQPGEDIISIHKLTIPPTCDSTLGYRLSVKGLPDGVTAYTRASLITIDHPPGMQLGGSALCGFRVDTVIGGIPVEDTTTMYGLREISLDSAFHSSNGVVTNALLDIDTLWTGLGSQDSLVLYFRNPIWELDTSYTVDSNIVIDSSRVGWTRSYILELHGRFEPGVGSGPTILLPTTVLSGPHSIGNSLKAARPNPASLISYIDYTIGNAEWGTLVLYDSKGVPLRTVIDRFHVAGDYSAAIDVSELPNGVYFYRLLVGNWSNMRSISVVQ